MHSCGQRLTFGAGLLCIVLAAASVHRATIAQLEQFLATQRTAHLSDSQTAQRLLSVGVSERLSAPTLARIKTEFHPGPETAAALDLEADLSEFLHLPVAELLQKSPPTEAAQQAMIRAAERFATGTLTHLPDYLATRTTRSFADVPILMSNIQMQSGLHPVGSSVREVAYRHGREIASKALPPGPGSIEPSQIDRSALHPTTQRLESAGEFGPVLATIMTDSAKGTITWSHWERIAGIPAAVFAYDVPKPQSHYRVDFCCISNTGPGSPDNYHGTPAYHGTFSIDPATGAILRVTLQAEFPEFNPQPQVQIMVDYRKVDVSGSGLMCPVRSVAVSEAYTSGEHHAWRNLFINEMTFTNFHRFGSTVQVVGNPPR